MELDDFVTSIKPFTKIFLLASLVCGVILTMQLMSPYTMVLHVPESLTNPLRYLTSIFFFPKISMSSIMQLIFFYFTTNQLEASYLPNKYGDFLFMILYLIIANYLILIPFSWGEFVILEKSLNLSLTYIYCRKHPNASIIMFFIIKLKAMYYIWVQLFFALIQDRYIYAISALVVGHSYYFLKDVLPVTKRVHFLKTPAFMNKIAEKFLVLMGEK